MQDRRPWQLARERHVPAVLVGHDLRLGGVDVQAIRPPFPPPPRRDQRRVRHVDHPLRRLAGEARRAVPRRPARHRRQLYRLLERPLATAPGQSEDLQNDAGRCGKESKDARLAVPAGGDLQRRRALVQAFRAWQLGARDLARGPVQSLHRAPAGVPEQGRPGAAHEVPHPLPAHAVPAPRAAAALTRRGERGAAAAAAAVVDHARHPEARQAAAAAVEEEGPGVEVVAAGPHHGRDHPVAPREGVADDHVHPPGWAAVLALLEGPEEEAAAAVLDPPEPRVHDPFAAGRAPEEVEGEAGGGRGRGRPGGGDEGRARALGGTAREATAAVAVGAGDEVASAVARGEAAEKPGAGDNAAPPPARRRRADEVSGGGEAQEDELEDVVGDAVQWMSPMAVCLPNSDPKRVARCYDMIPVMAAAPL